MSMGMGMRGIAIGLTMVLLGGCGDRTSSAKSAAQDEKPLPTTLFEGLPLSGNLANAGAGGFGGCLDGNYGLRCHREGVKVMGVGPFSAAVDLDATAKDAPARFDHVTVWRAGDQSAVLEIGNALKAAGWQSCLTPDAERYWLPASPVRIAIDTNYWGIRRLMISAPAPSPAKYC